MNFHCYGCKLQFTAKNFNVAILFVRCPVCNTRNHIAKSINRVYGKAIGDEAYKLIDGVERVCAKSRSDCSKLIHMTYLKLEALTKSLTFSEQL